MILSLAYSLSFARAPISVVGSAYGGGSYLAVFQDKAEASCDRLERGEGICGVPHPTEEQFGRGRRSGLPVSTNLGSVPFVFAPCQPMLDTLLQSGERISYVVHVDFSSAKMVVAIIDGWPRGFDSFPRQRSAWVQYITYNAGNTVSAR